MRMPLHRQRLSTGGRGEERNSECDLTDVEDVEEEAAAVSESSLVVDKGTTSRLFPDLRMRLVGQAATPPSWLCGAT
jgi:hypothetical protein